MGECPLFRGQSCPPEGKPCFADQRAKKARKDANQVGYSDAKKYEDSIRRREADNHCGRLPDQA